MSNSLNVMIAGAGIGGLTAAACLILSGHKVRIFEQAPELGEIGAGLQVSANGFKVMRHIGVESDLLKWGVRPNAYVFKIAETGEEVNRFELAETHERINGAPYVQLHRADLHAALAKRVLELDPDCIRLNAKVAGYEAREEGVDLKLENGEVASGDVLIAGDGIKSAIRAQMLGATPANFTGDIAWRLTIPASRLPEGFLDKVMTVWLGQDCHAVMYYLRNMELINFVGLKERDDWREESWTSKGSWDELKDDFASWTDNIHSVLDVADKDECYRWALFNRKPIDVWNEGPVALLGDAAHPTLPYLAQGAVMAIEDAAILARALSQTVDPVEGLAVYSKTRAQRAARVVNESSANQRKFRGSVQELRDRYIGAEIGKDRNSWLYNFDVFEAQLQTGVTAQ